MSFKDDYNFEYLINEAERLVLSHLESQLSEEREGDMCLCQDCILDMAAFALNNVKPLYRVSLMGNLYAKALEGSEYETEISEAVSAAVKRISANPSH
ncbi:MAG: late competence development ComFB family protein [Spirochaetales bacterium]|jgi:competence protein ComFB|nr:late competence development ComFB family protein [Spirochaetales bacterium]